MATIIEKKRPAYNWMTDNEAMYYDAFEDASVDYTKWTSSGTVNETGGQLILSVTASGSASGNSFLTSVSTGIKDTWSVYGTFDAATSVNNNVDNSNASNIRVYGGTSGDSGSKNILAGGNSGITYGSFELIRKSPGIYDFYVNGDLASSNLALVGNILIEFNVYAAHSGSGSSSSSLSLNEVIVKAT